MLCILYKNQLLFLNLITIYLKGLSIQEVANLLGHDSTTTTERYYADVITESLRKKINNANKDWDYF